VRLAGVLAPPYDVIDDSLREELYGRDLRNIVRIDYGKDLAGDIAGKDDRYTRAAGHLDSWLRLGILRRDEQPAVYVHEHRFRDEAGQRSVRRGLFARIAALPWDRAEIRPHERTLRAPKEDRLALMRATRTQTSAVFALWKGAAGIDDALDAATAGDADMTGHHRGELDREEHRLWVVDQPERVAGVLEALSSAQLYVADGHHRFETAVAYAEERRAAEPDAPEDADFGLALLYICDAADPAIEVLPTHRLVRGGASAVDSVAGLRSRLAPSFTVEPRYSLAGAVADAGALRATRHAFAVAALDGVVLVHTPRRAATSPRAVLDVSVLERDLLGAALGIDAEAISRGALEYTRNVSGAEAAVARGESALAICLNPCTTAEIVAVADAGETMPQKSTYFYPKVPTGLVLSPL
jgi:uncharacterized protein (DUF1015 family)